MEKEFKTYKVISTFYVKTCQFPKPEGLREFVESTILDYQGTEYIAGVSNEGVVVEEVAVTAEIGLTVEMGLGQTTT